MASNPPNSALSLPSIPIDALLLIVDLLPFSGVYHLSLTCKWACNGIKTLKQLYSRKVLSAFGLRVSRIERRAFGLNGIPSSVGQPAGILSYRPDMKSLTVLRVASRRAGNITCATACDEGILARIQATGHVIGNDNVPAVRICCVTVASSDEDTHSVSGWALLIDSGRPLEIAISVDLDMLAVLCTRNETHGRSDFLEVQCYRLSADAFHVGPFRTISLRGLGFDPRSVPRDKLRCRLLLNGEKILVFIAENTNFDNAFVCVLVWSRIGWGEVILRRHKRSYDAAWLSYKVLGILSDDDGLETHEVTYVWPLTVEKRTNFFLSRSTSVDMLTLTVSVSAIRPTRHFVGRRSFYHSWAACEHLLRVPRARKKAGHGIVVITASVPSDDAGNSHGYTLVVTVSYIMALALSERGLSWETWNAQVRVTANDNGQDFQGRVAEMTTVEWRDTNDVRFREDSPPRDTAVTIEEPSIGKYLVLTHYDTSADVTYSPLVIGNGATTSAVDGLRDRLVRGTRWSKTRAVFRQNVSTVMGIDGCVFHDDMSNALVYREEILFPHHDYAHMLLDRGILWTAEVVDPASTTVRWDVFAISNSLDDADDDGEDGEGTEADTGSAGDADASSESSGGSNHASDEEEGGHSE